MAGRPRKWESNAERQRAYRDRRRQELAEPSQLRDQVRDLQKRWDLMRSSLARARTAKDRMHARLTEAEAQIDELNRLRTALQNSNQEQAEYANRLQIELDQRDVGAQHELERRLSIAVSQIRVLAAENERLRLGAGSLATPTKTPTRLSTPTGRAVRRKTDRKKQRKKRGKG